MTQSGPFESRHYPIREDMRQQLLTWRVQRVAWIGIGLVCLATALGAFGGGPLAEATRSDPAGRLRIDYERIERREAAAVLRLRATGLPPGGEATVRYGDGFVGVRSLRRIEPGPVRASAGPEGLTHVYAVPASGTLEVAVEYRPREVGRSRGSVALAGGPELALDQLVLP